MKGGHCVLGAPSVTSPGARAARRVIGLRAELGRRAGWGRAPSQLRGVPVVLRAALRGAPEAWLSPALLHPWDARTHRGRCGAANWLWRTQKQQLHANTALCLSPPAAPALSLQHPRWIQSLFSLPHQNDARRGRSSPAPSGAHGTQEAQPVN
ncbi:hypothetical protein NDU88_006727 [Pleurodeles waltl]|uniref:Uncharacterized protein n=1 Tax=Pleurodeles waltl TaxID=8319 RepID=A0AAV7TYF1_PLEWA|nr:hypothetical protein NDU88_006727 [Pleurodeles waltl]